MAEFRFIRDVAHYVFDSDKEFTDHWIHEGLSVGEIPKIKDDWKAENVTAGDWVRADDGGIVQVLKVGHMKNTCRSPDKKLHSTKYVRTIIGPHIVNEINLMDSVFGVRGSRYSFSKTAKNGKTPVLDRENIIVRERAFVTYFTHYNPNPGEAYMIIYETKNEKYAERRAYILLNQPRIQMAIKKEVQSSAVKLEVSDHWVLDKLKKIADGTSKENVEMGAVVNIGKIIGTFDRTPNDAPGSQPKIGDGKEVIGIPDISKALVEATESHNKTNVDVSV